MSKLRETYKAIQLINSDARVMALSFPGGEPDLDNIIWEDGTTPISKADIEAKLPEARQVIADEDQAKIDKKASGKQKLKDLGLDEEEINALMGA